VAVNTQKNKSVPDLDEFLIQWDSSEAAIDDQRMTPQEMTGFMRGLNASLGGTEKKRKPADLWKPGDPD
jgi:hypothetical protein